MITMENICKTYKVAKRNAGFKEACHSLFHKEYEYIQALDNVSFTIDDGGFYRVLVRPRGTIIQVLGSKFELTRCGRMLQAIVMFIYGIGVSHMDWNLSKIITVIFMIIGGTAVFSGLFLVYAALCFFTLEGLEFMNVFTDGGREFGKYPIGIYGKRILQFCTFVIPYALVQYYPLLYILGQKQSVGWVFVPLLAILFLIPCYGLWRFGVRKYQSSGS